MNHAARLLFAVLIAVFAASLPLAAAGPPPLHTVEDYLEHSPDQILDAPLRQSLREAGRESRGELPASDLLRYGASYRFASPELDMAVLLLIGRDEAAASTLLRDFLSGDDAGSESRLGIRRRALAGTPAIAGARYEQLLDAGGETASGNRLIVLQKNKLYIVIMSGIGGFDAAAAADRFLRLHLSPILAFDPQRAASGQPLRPASDTR